jgi:hypothetical protein
LLGDGSESELSNAASRARTLLRGVSICIGFSAERATGAGLDGVDMVGDGEGSAGIEQSVEAAGPELVIRESRPEYQERRPINMDF